MSDRDIQVAVRKLAGTFKTDAVSVFIGTVDSVSESAATCDVKLLTGVLMKGVKLQEAVCDGVLIIPKKDSGVRVLHTPQTGAFIVGFSDIDKLLVNVGDAAMTVKDGTIELNDGSYGGAVKVQDLVNKLNALENLVNNILTTLKGTTIPLAPSGTYSFATLYAALNNINPITKKSDLENDKVKHGK